MTHRPLLRIDGRLPVLLSVCLAGIICPISFLGGVVATPAIGRELGGDPVALTWITNAFMLTFGGFQMAAGALANVYGRKRIFLIGLVLFAASALALSYVRSVYLLDLLRFVQGVAAAATLAGGTASLAQEFDGHARTRAFSLLGTTFGVGLAFGPLFAGYMIETFGWSSVFLSTALVAILALVFGARRMTETRDPNAADLDVGGTATFTGALTLFTFALIQAPASGWTSSTVLALLVGAAGLLTAFVVVETRIARPMLDISLFCYPRFVGVQVLPIATCYCYVVLLVLLPLRFIGIEGYSEVQAGVVMLAISAPMLAVPSLAAAATRWISPATISVVGLVIAALGLFFLGRADITDGYTTLGPMFLIGLGASMPWGLMDGLSISVVPKERAVMATGIFNTTRVAGEGVALATVSAILAALLESLLENSLSKVEHGGRTLAMTVAQNLATGNLTQATKLLPGVDPEFLAQCYADAFRILIYILILITLICAAIVFYFLGRSDGALDTKEVRPVSAGTKRIPWRVEGRSKSRIQASTAPARSKRAQRP